MNEPKPFASLSPSLLARKGGARPAMRPQLASLNHVQGAAVAHQMDDDLGWNDMGEADLPQPVSLHPMTGLTADHQIEDDFGGNPMGDAETQVEVESPPALVAAEILQLKPQRISAPVERPAILRQQEEVAERMAAPAGKPRVRRSAASKGRRAAFTLRIDPERHLQLRLACTLTGRSAQQLMTEALDKLILGLPDVSAMAENAGKDRS